MAPVLGAMMVSVGSCTGGGADATAATVIKAKARMEAGDEDRRFGWFFIGVVIKRTGFGCSVLSVSRLLGTGSFTDRNLLFRRPHVLCAARARENWFWVPPSMR